MPELPEVETTKRGLETALVGKAVTDVLVRNPSLRWPVQVDLLTSLKGQMLISLSRRSKYLLFDFGGETWLVHLGMSGSMRLARQQEPLRTHDHISVTFQGGLQLRYHDPRRFGSWVYGGAEPMKHKLLVSLGPEPLTRRFNGKHLSIASQGRNTPVKQFIMDAKIVVGVGNIYANEALFEAKILPFHPARIIDQNAYNRLSRSIKSTLRQSIKQGGTTLRDFSGSTGEPGYFKQSLRVYGRDGEACNNCKKPIAKTMIGQRATFWCPACQQ